MKTKKRDFMWNLKAALIAAFFWTGMGMIGQADAMVSGVCSNCHTMHNSQNASALVSAGAGAGWDESAISGDESNAAQNSLLISDCVGCHTNTGSETIISIGGSRVPIVNNHAIPTNPLAGGNFYWIAQITQQGYDSKGHNVRGISAQDLALSVAPGAVGCSSSCHTSLTLTDAQTYQQRKNGCQGCHNLVRHHGPDPAGTPVDEAGGWFRFLSAPSGHDMLGGAGVSGIEDPDWEQNPTASAHNVYYAGTGGDNDVPQSIGKFCSGCHYKFHSPGVPTTFIPIDNGGGSNPWLRHPADAVIPNEYEYADVIGTDYDPSVPVAKPDLRPGFFDRTKVENGDRVTCLSCHRAHGSPYPDMLRWDYLTMKTGATDAAAGTGCFKCHTTKDGV